MPVLPRRGTPGRGNLFGEVEKNSSMLPHFGWLEPPEAIARWADLRGQIGPARRTHTLCSAGMDQRVGLAIGRRLRAFVLRIFARRDSLDHGSRRSRRCRAIHSSRRTAGVSARTGARVHADEPPVAAPALPFGDAKTCKQPHGDAAAKPLPRRPRPANLRKRREGVRPNSAIARHGRAARLAAVTNSRTNGHLARRERIRTHHTNLTHCILRNLGAKRRLHDC